MAQAVLHCTEAFQCVCPCGDVWINSLVGRYSSTIFRIRKHLNTADEPQTPMCATAHAQETIIIMSKCIISSTVIAQVRTLVVIRCGNNKDVTLFIRRAYSTKTKLNENSAVFDGKWSFSEQLLVIILRHDDVLFISYKSKQGTLQSVRTSLHRSLATITRHQQHHAP